MQYRVEFDTLPWQQREGVRFKMVDHQGTRLRLVEYTKAMPPHWCTKGHCGYMLAGEFEIRFDHGTHIFKPGDGVFIPAGAEHRHMAIVRQEPVRCIFVEAAE